MEPFSLRLTNWLLVRVPVIPFPLGIFFWYVYLRSQSPLALGACKLSFGLFLLMPAWYLAFRSDLAIALLNALYAFIKPHSAYEPVRPLFKKTSWKALTRAERIILAVIAIVSLGFGLLLIIQGYPILFQLFSRGK